MRNPGSGGETRGGGPAAAAMSGAAEAGAGDEEDPEWASLLLSEIDGLIGEDELPLNAEMETYEKNFCDLDFDLDLMSWNSEPWDVSKQILADEDWKAEPLSPITSAESVPSPVSVDSPGQCVPEGTELESNPQPSPIYLYSQSSQSPPLPVEEKEKKSLSKAKHCSANGSSVTLNRCNPLTTKPLIQPKPLLPAHAGLGVQAKAIVIPALYSLLTLPKQQPVVAIQPALPNGQPVTFSQSAVVHLQTPAIFPGSKPAVAITGGITSLPGQTMNILSQTARKNSATANTLTKPVLNATSPNTGIEMNVLKRQQRMIKNRESACQSRRKRKEYMLNLEVRLKAALLENDHLKRENGLLKRQLDELAEENQDLKSSPPKRRAFYVMVLLAFIVLNYDRLSVLEWGSTSSEVHTRPAHQSRHLLEFSPGIPQETGDKNNNGYKHSVSDNKALMVVTEEPIIYISPPPCQPFINHTESLRLSHELRGWVHRHEAERTKSRRTSKNQLQKDQAAQNVTRKNANSELMALPYMDNSVGNSGSELQVYYASPRKYQDFFDAIHRKGDTFYVVSFRRDHLLLPATTHNKTRRPKMSIVLPAINISDKIINGQDYEVMMQIDCEVMDTRILHIKSSSIPPYLRDQQRNRTTSFYSSPLTVPEAAPVVRTYTESPK